ncbi:hypothetical protein HID58_009294 [Brassica napus]|uniref:Methyltransferase n=1 Tax=Brassica napus TaxID=3708 RepID=A0ABQ8DS29_BRANA|nr:hypothetical protein HID58_009294 [Brassica napus]
MAPLSSSSSSSSPNPRLIPWSRELCAVNTFSQPSVSSEPTAKLAISSDPNRVLTSGSVAAATSRIGAFAGLGQHYARCYWDFSKARLRYRKVRTFNSNPLFNKVQNFNSNPLLKMVVAKTVDSSGRGLVIYQKPTSESCYNHLFVLKRKNAPLRQCISKLPSGGVQKWPELWPKRLVSVKPQSVSADTNTSKKDTEKWSEIVSDVYLERLAVNWFSMRNVMDMNASFGG